MSKAGVSAQDVVITFGIEQVVVSEKARFFKIVFDYEGHETKGEVDEVSKNDPVVRNAFNSMPNLKPKLIFLHELLNINLVRFDFATLITKDDLIFLTYVKLAISVLKSERSDANVK